MMELKIMNETERSKECFDCGCSLQGQVTTVFSDPETGKTVATCGICSQVRALKYEYPFNAPTKSDWEKLIQPNCKSFLHYKRQGDICGKSGKSGGLKPCSFEYCPIK
jgi:hypothetical protein